jgi:acyl carrier protein
MSVAEQIVKLVAETAGVPVSTVSAETELWRDLRVGGDDMLELFLRIQSEFSVNLDGLDLKTYSPDEDDALLTQGSEWIRKKLHLHPDSRYASMKVADLIAAVESKSWSKRK